MRKITTNFIGILLCLTAIVTSQAQNTLRGTQNYSDNRYGDKRYTQVDWSMDYHFEMGSNNGSKAIIIVFTNPKVMVSANSKYKSGGLEYSKSDLGVSYWPGANQCSCGEINVTIDYEGKTYGAVGSQWGGGGKPYTGFVSFLSNMPNVDLTKFKVNTKEWFYNGAEDNELEKIIREKKYGKKDQNITTTTNTSNNSTTSSNGNSTTTNSGSSTSNSNNGTYQNSGAQNQTSNTASNQQLTQQQLDEQFYAKQKANTAAYDAKIADQTAINNFQKNYETGQQIGNVVVGLVNLFTPTPEQIARRQQQAADAQAVRDRQAAYEQYKAQQAIAEVNRLKADFKRDYLDKYLKDAEAGDENLRMILIYNDYLHMLPNKAAWIKEAVKNNNFDALNISGEILGLGQIMLGQLDQMMMPVKEKEQGRLLLLKKAANLGSTDAMIQLGIYYDRKDIGDSKSNNADTAYYWIEKAAELGCPKGAYCLGMIYRYNYTTSYKSPFYAKYKVKKDPDKAFYWFNKSISNMDRPLSLFAKYKVAFAGPVGDPFSSVFDYDTFKELGLMHKKGIGCPKNPKLAEEFMDMYCKTVKQGGYPNRYCD